MAYTISQESASPAQEFTAITPSDSAATNALSRWIITGIGGTLSFKDMQGTTVSIVTAAGGWYQVATTQIRATGTTALSILTAR